MKIKGKVTVRFSDGELYNKYPSTELETLIYSNGVYVGFKVFDKDRNSWDYYSNHFQWEVEAE